MIQKEFARIMSLKDGTKKMSKSDISDLTRINLSDSKDDIFNKIKKAKTDALPIPEKKEDLKDRPEAENLLGIYSCLSDQNLEITINQFSGKNFSEFKNSLSDLMIEKISPISDEIKKLKGEKSYIDKILLEGKEKAESISQKKVEKIKELIGF